MKRGMWTGAFLCYRSQRGQRLSHVSTMSGKALQKPKEACRTWLYEEDTVDTASPEIPFVGITGGEK